MPNGKPTIAFIGFGEAGQAIAAGLREAGVETMAAWDILFPQAAGEKLKRAADAAGVRCANSAADAVRGVDLIISAVTAASSVEAAQAVKAHLAGTPYFLDINSVSPGRKQDTAKLLGDAGRYGLAGFAEADECDCWLAVRHGDGSLKSTANDGSFGANVAMAAVSIAAPAR